ncbi:hypothetical protein HY463_01385 [Candidatus Peregrinibacteria bacterium]|nr:hypothetical protein [Candidatus Peregrinibacteria bacterium]
MSRKKAITVFVILSFTVAAVLAMGGMGGHENMTDCPFAYHGQSVCATAGVAEWSRIFTVDRSVFAKAVMSVFVMAVVLPTVLPRRRRNYFSKFFDYILRALSDGTLHPTLYG